MKTESKIKKNTMFDVAFTVIHFEDPDAIPVESLLEALEKRLNHLKNNLDEAKEAFGICDTFEYD